MKRPAPAILCLVLLLLAAGPADGQDARERIVVAAGESFAPYVFRNARDEPAGMDVDLWRLWAVKTGVEVEIRLMTWSDAIPALLAGDVDVVDGVSLTPERRNLLGFSKPYNELSAYVFFHESLGGISGLEDLSGFLVGVVKGSNVEEHVSREAPGIERQPYPDHESMVRAALEGRLRVFVAEEPTVPYEFAKAGRTGGFRRSDRPILTTDLRIAVRKEETGLLALVQRGLDAISREEYEEIEESWSGVSLTEPIRWEYILGIAGVLFLGTLALIGWNRLLRRRISDATTTIRQSEERFRALVETTSDWIWEVDEELRYTYVSPTVTQLLGYAPEEVLGRSPMDLMPPEEAERVGSLVAPLIRDRAPFVGIRNMCVSKDGRPVVLETSGLPILDRDGRLRGYRGVDRDITERQAVEQELRREKDFSTLVINSLPGIFYLYEDGKRLVRWNRNHEVATGFEPDELLGRSPLDWFAGEDAEHIADRIGKVFEMGEATAEARLIRKDGVRTPYYFTGHHMTTEEGSYLLGVGIDISEQKRAEEALRESEERYRTIVEHSPIPIIVHCDERVVLVNRRAVEALGASSPDDILGSSIWQYSDPEMRDVLEDRVARVYKGEEGAADLLEEKFTTVDGRVIEVEVMGTPVSFQGRPASQVVFTDITQRRSLEAQLRHSQKMEAIGLLAGGVAHDFNNILQAVLGYNEIALDNLPADSLVRAQLFEVRSAAEKAASLTQQLLSFSRRKALERVNLNLNLVIADLTRMLRRVIGEHVDLEVLSDPRIRTVSADQSQVEQILMNLCINARDAMPDGGTLTIETMNVRIDEEACEGRPWARPGDFVAIRASDTGKGVSPEIRDRLFEPFFTTKEVGQGSGLGLATVYAIVERHGGMVEVKSEEGAGATFEIFLPASLGPEAAAREEGAAEEEVDGSETILVAEDDGPVRELAIEVLESAGYRLLVAENGREAIRLLDERADEVHLAFLDVVMPKSSGAEVYEFIRKRKPEMPVLFSSGYSHTVLREHDITEEDCRLLQKPYSPSDLLREIRRCLK